MIDESDTIDTPEVAYGTSLMESRTVQLDDQLLERLEGIFAQSLSRIKLKDITKIAYEHSSVDIAHAAARLPSHYRLIIYENLPSRARRADFIINAESDTRRAILRALSEKEIKRLADAMPLDEAASLIEELPERRLKRLYDLLDPKKALQIQELISHERTTAARIMSGDFFTFSLETTVGEATASIRDRPEIDCTRCVFILDEQGKMQGYVAVRSLLISPDNTPLKNLLRYVAHSVDLDSTREEVVEIVERYKLSALPVLDNEGKLVGVITYDDVIEAIEDITDETLARMAGTAEKVTEHQSGLRRFFSRAPWLLVTLMAGLVNMEVMSYYASAPKVFLYFVPLIMGLSGNIGLQSSTVLVRGIAVGIVSPKNKWKVAIKEMTLGVMTGLIFGLACGLVVYVLSQIGLDTGGITPRAISVIVSGGLASACIGASLLGVLVPLLFAKIGVDPAIASGPIITACNDFLSMLIYFLIASCLTFILLG